MHKSRGMLSLDVIWCVRNGNSFSDSSICGVPAHITWVLYCVWTYLPARAPYHCRYWLPPLLDSNRLQGRCPLFHGRYLVRNPYSILMFFWCFGARDAFWLHGYYITVVLLHKWVLNILGKLEQQIYYRVINLSICVSNAYFSIDVWNFLFQEYELSLKFKLLLKWHLIWKKENPEPN